MLVELRRARIVRYAVVPWLVVVVSGCQKWVDIDIGPQLPERVRVTQRPPEAPECERDAPHFQIWDPVVVGDTLTGRATEETITVQPILPVTEICGLEGRGPDTVATIAAALLGGGLVFGVIMVAVVSSSF